LTPSRDSKPPSRQTGPTWPTEGLDVRSLRDEGWKPRPFQQFIIKLHGRCNLSCTYCYVYTLADKSWRDKPATISMDTLDRTAYRIAEHVCQHQLAGVEVILHGGEPLLCGAGFIRDAVRRLREALPAGTAMSVRLQTNGTLLTPGTLDMLLEHDVMVGVSFDGTARSHDSRRVHANGRGSHAEAAEALRLLAGGPYASIFAGILCTIDVSADPAETYESLAGFSPPRIDFLLPHANWSAPPAAGHGEWLAAAFDRWYRGGETRVRLFEEIIRLLIGGHSSTEMIGLSAVALIVVDTDGSVEQVDTLKSAFPGAPETGMNVFTNSFDDALAHPSIAARQIGIRALSDRCMSCPVHKICGGGYYPHRYHPASGFRNPSVYCTDLRHLITHISRRVRTDLLAHRAC
jgi:uncharacterized protein